MEEGEEDLVEENDWTKQEIQQSQQPYPEPQSVEERGSAIDKSDCRAG